MSVPAVSIVIPTFNRERELPAAIASVRAQTYPDWELLVVDDASTDGTEAVALGIGDDRIRYLRQPLNRGAAAARWVGIEAARAAYVAFLDSDDTWRPEKLARHLAFVAAAPETRRLSCTSFTIRRSDGRPAEIRRLAGEVGHREMLRGCFFSPGSTMLADRALMAEVGPFDPNLRRLEDWDWLLRATRRQPLALLDEVLTDISVGGGPSTAAVRSAVEAMAGKTAAYGIAGGADRSLFLSTLQHELAAAHYYQGDYARACAHVARSLLHKPGKGADFYRRAWRRLRQDAHKVLSPTSRL